MGFKAKLLFPVWVIIEQKDVASTVMDDDAREPIKQARRKTEIKIKAQVSYSTTTGTSFFQGGQGGPSGNTSGHLVFLTRILLKKGYVFVRGDRIKSIGGKSVEHYFDAKDLAGHNRGSSELEVWDFIDYDPLKKKG